MKTVFKKMLSLALAAMLLVTAVPFAALAAENEDATTEATITETTTAVISEPETQVAKFQAHVFVREKGNSANVVAEGTAKVENNTVTYDELVAFIPANTDKVTYKVEKVRMPEHDGKVVNPGTTVELTDDTIFNVFVTITEVEETKPTETKPVETKPTETKPTETKPTETKPTETKPTETKPTESEHTIANLYVNGEKVGVAVFDEDGKMLSCTEAPKLEKKDFQGWYSKENGKGYELEKNMGGKVIYDNYYAYYIDSSDDDLCTLSVVAVYYVNGTEKARKTVYSENFEEGTKDALNILIKNEDTIWNNIVKKVPSSFVDNKFKWEPRKFYDKSFTNDLTTQDLVLNGDRTVYVKVNSTVEAPVSLEIHTKVSSKAQRTVWMTGYLAGDLVTLNDAIKYVKDYYSVSSKNVKMYSDDQWQDLVDNDNTAKFVEQVEVESNSKTTKIHVLLSNATSSSSSKADSSNPKTGDNIVVAMSVMVVTASALAAAYVYNKKRVTK